MSKSGFYYAARPRISHVYEAFYSSKVVAFSNTLTPEDDAVVYLLNSASQWDSDVEDERAVTSAPAPTSAYQLCGQPTS